MTLDIRGSLKNTRISKNPLVVVDELLANSIDAFLIRKRDESDAVALKATLKLRKRTCSARSTILRSPARTTVAVLGQSSARRS